MKKSLFLMSVIVFGSFLSGCTTYENRVIDEGTVTEQRMIVE